MLAEAALDALVDDIIPIIGKHRYGLQVFDMCSWVGVDKNIRIEDVVRIQQLLDAHHDVVGNRPPFALHKGGHVSPRSVLGLERSLVTIHDDFDDSFHRHQNHFGPFIFGDPRPVDAAARIVRVIVPCDHCKTGAMFPMGQGNAGVTRDGADRRGAGEAGRNRLRDVRDRLSGSSGDGAPGA